MTQTVSTDDFNYRGTLMRKKELGKTTILAKFGQNLFEYYEPKIKDRVLRKINYNILDHNNEIKVKFFMSRDREIDRQMIMSDSISKDCHMNSKNKSFLTMIRHEKYYKRIGMMENNLKCVTAD